MVTDLEYSLGFRARDDLAYKEEIEIVPYSPEPIDEKQSRMLGLAAIVATEVAQIGEDTYSLTTTNRALLIDRGSTEDQRAFGKLYRAFVGQLQRNSQPYEYEPDEPNIEETIVARAVMDMGMQDMVTLGAFIAYEQKQGGKHLHVPSLVFAKPLGQALALDLRDQMVGIDIDDAKAKMKAGAETAEEGELFEHLLSITLPKIKVADEYLVNFLGYKYIVDHLQTPNEIRKQLGYAPPKSKKR